MIYRPVNLATNVPSPEARPHYMDFIARNTQTLAIVACMSWLADEATPARTEFHDRLSEMVNSVADSDYWHQNRRASSLVLDTSLLARTEADRPHGLAGLSLVVADNGESPGIIRPYVKFTNYLGTTGILVPNSLKEHLSLDMASYPPSRTGVYQVTEIKNYVDYDHLADTHELMFEEGTDWTAYIGSAEELSAWAGNSATAALDASPLVASIHATTKRQVTAETQG